MNDIIYQLYDLNLTEPVYRPGTNPAELTMF
jgi:hypothetical protein